MEIGTKLKDTDITDKLISASAVEEGSSNESPPAADNVQFLPQKQPSMLPHLPPPYSTNTPPTRREHSTTAPGAVHPFPKRGEGVSDGGGLGGWMSAYQPAGNAAPLWSQTQPQQQPGALNVVRTQPLPYQGPVGERPKDYLILSILTTLFCCWLLGIFAIQESKKVRTAWLSGDHSKAQECSQSALRINIIAMVVGFLAQAGIITGFVLLRVYYWDKLQGYNN